ncbi:4-carboxy-2-hydroxymuconate semialdehyde dehydrogenase [Pseudomonas duriflava]|uniref:4-carboxy-2-hydroxymuconate semialdehyde dehydrogenase n=1 Tax=Pseudomonas duriflava TaxID=459528 RepID=A0A562QNK6_9PSED|nr:Gfo/Idh/MocA family oxidoreductase [Pseudomonas duriflava]TWI58324.1 4-carboxy-2-hydroxymuconate semialdehyde dehydrogenase [Pseudomonas duriflava]
MTTSSPIRVLLAGEGAIAATHMQALQGLDDVEVVCLAGGLPDDTARFAAEWGIPNYSLDYELCLLRENLDAVILATPSPLHAQQATQALSAGKPVLVEIPMSLSLSEAEALAKQTCASGQICMIAHTRRFNPSHREIRRRIQAGEFHLQHLVAETYFFRRDNRNMHGQPRTWTDHLLWHHACHTVDLFAWLLEDSEIQVWGIQGPRHPTLGIAMDMTIGMRSVSGVMATLSLSFNNRGPFGSFYRYIGEEDTLHVFRDELKNHEGHIIPLSGNGFALQDREFFAAIREGRQPESSVESCLPAMRLLDQLDRQMNPLL